MITPLQQEDVAVLKCIYFNLVKSLKEIYWYDLSCQEETYIENVEKAFSYLIALDSGCSLEHAFLCEIKAFIRKQTACNTTFVQKCLVRYVNIPV